MGLIARSLGPYAAQLPSPSFLPRLLNRALERCQTDPDVQPTQLSYMLAAAKVRKPNHHHKSSSSKSSSSSSSSEVIIITIITITIIITIIIIIIIVITTTIDSPIPPSLQPPFLFLPIHPTPQAAGLELPAESLERIIALFTPERIESLNDHDAAAALLALAKAGYRCARVRGMDSIIRGTRLANTQALCEDGRLPLRPAAPPPPPFADHT
jgi:hypothetical protein